MIQDTIFIGSHLINNRIVLQPMEGYDCELDGTPSDLTAQKYIRAAQSGAGTIWFEATAVCPEGRTNDHQMMLTEHKCTKNHRRNQFCGDFCFRDVNKMLRLPVLINTFLCYSHVTSSALGISSERHYLTLSYFKHTAR